jgi:hypothetical protein
MSRSIGLEAAKRKVAAFIRLAPPFYETSLEKKLANEKAELKPASTRGIWWHETLRMLAAIKE